MEMEPMIMGLIAGLLCCLVVGVLLLLGGGFLLWKRSKAGGDAAVTSGSDEEVARESEDTLVSERSTAAVPDALDDGPSIATESQGGTASGIADSSERPRQAAQTIIAFDDDFDEDDDL